MAITKISIENFKGIGDRVEVELKPITILFGANSAGKSTILQAMLYLRELLEHRNADADRLKSSGASIDLGGFQQFVHCHDLNREVKIGVTVEVSDDGIPTVPVLEIAQGHTFYFLPFSEYGITKVKTVSIEVTVGWRDLDDVPEIREYSVELDGQPFASLKAESPQQCYLAKCDFYHSTLEKEFGDSLTETQALESYLEANSMNDREAILKGDYRVPINSLFVVPNWNKPILPTGFLNVLSTEADTSREFEDYLYAQIILSQLLVGSGILILEELQKIRYVGPIRSLPVRNFTALRSPAMDRWADGVAAWDLLYHSAASSDEGGLIKTTSEFLSEEKRLNIGYSLSANQVYEVAHNSFALNTLRILASRSEDEEVETRIQQIIKDISESPQTIRLQLRDLANDTLVSPNDIGVGVSQVVPVIVAALYKGASLVAVEQPELHLHPAIQARMGDLFIESALKEGVENRFILESHSEHLILRLLRRIRECHEEGAEYPDHLPEIKPEELSVYYIRPEGSQTKMVKLRVSADGDFLDRWPDGFFDERAEELF